VRTFHRDLFQPKWNNRLLQLHSRSPARCRLWVIHVIPAIPAFPVRLKSGHSANARVYEYAHYRAPLVLSLSGFPVCGFG